MRFDNAGTTNNGALNQNTLTFSFAVAGNFLAVAIPESRASSITSVTYNGAGMTLGKSALNSPSLAWIYYILNPTIGTNDIVITYGTSQTGYICGALSLFGVDPVNPIGNSSTTTGTAQNKSLALTTVSYGSYIIDCIGAQGGVHTPHASQTSLVANSNRIASYKQVGAAGSGVGDMSYTSTASAAYGYCSMEIRGLVVPQRKFWHGVNFSAIGQKGVA